MNRTLSRRDLLKKGAAALVATSVAAPLLPAASNAQTLPDRGRDLSIPTNPTSEMDSTVFVFPRVQYKTLVPVKGEWDIFPIADENFLRYLERSVNIKLSKRNWQERVVRIEDISRRHDLPFLFMTGEGDFRLSESERSAFAEFFRRGGFLYADDCITEQDGHFFSEAFAREFRGVLPGISLEPVPPDHDIYHCFYEFPGRSPDVQGSPRPDMALICQERMVALLTGCDIHCGWWGVIFASKQEIAFRFGVNVVVYALTH